MSDFRKQLLAMWAPRVLPVKVTAGGRDLDVHVRELSAQQIFDLQAKHKEGGGDAGTFALLLLSSTLCDEKGAAIYDGVDSARETLLLKAEAFNKLTEAVAKANGLGGVEAGKA
jgi:hypothetical protein